MEHLLGIPLAKEHSSADWSTRPLPQSWLVYAALVATTTERASAARERLRRGKQACQAGQTGQAGQARRHEVLQAGLPCPPPAAAAAALRRRGLCWAWARVIVGVAVGNAVAHATVLARRDGHDATFSAPRHRAGLLGLLLRESDGGDGGTALLRGHTVDRFVPSAGVRGGAAVLATVAGVACLAFERQKDF